MGGSTLATGLALWHLRSLNCCTAFKTSLAHLRKWTGLSEKSTRNGLHQLEARGLVFVSRQDGRSPVITLVEQVPSSRAKTSQSIPVPGTKSH